MTENDGSVYDESYFLRGKETGKSLYENYRWMPDLTIPMVSRIISHCGILPENSILDFGCARGYTVRAFRELGYNAWGHDVSRWALENADKAAKKYLILDDSFLVSGHITTSFDWVIAKDVLEHVLQVADTIKDLMRIAQVGVFAVVPLGTVDPHYYGKDTYVVPSYDLDVTHIHRLELATWARMFVQPGWSVTMSYRVPGIKDNYAKYEKGNGFLVARRMAPAGQ